MSEAGPATILLRPRAGKSSLLQKLRRACRRVLPIPSPARLLLEYRRGLNRLHLLRHWWLKPHTPYRAAFVIATPRCGSNLLLDYLDKLPDVQCNSEVLNWRMSIGPPQHQNREQAIAHIRRSLQTMTAPLRVCKLFLNNLLNYHLELDDLAEAFPDSKFLILYRQSLAEQFTSMELAKSTKQWLLLDGQVQEKKPIAVDPAALRTYCEKTRQQYRATIARPWLASRGVLLSYEELSSNPDGHLSEQICPLLGVRPAMLQTRLRKQNPEPLSQRIANYAEVAQLLESSLCQQRHVWPWQQQPARRLAA